MSKAKGNAPPRNRKRDNEETRHEPKESVKHDPAMDVPSDSATSQEEGRRQAEEHGEASPQNEAMQRAEDILDETGKKLGHLAAELGVRLRRVAAMAREEAEDFWAEAQSVRRGDMK